MYLFKQREHLQCDHVLSEVIPQLQNKPCGCLMQCSWDDILHLQPQGLLWIESHHKQWNYCCVLFGARHRHTGHCTNWHVKRLICWYLCRWQYFAFGWSEFAKHDSAHWK